jgi:hypothetical protein
VPAALRAMEEGCIYRGISGIHPAVLYTVYYTSPPPPPPPHKLSNKCRQKKRNLRKNVIESVPVFSSSNLRTEEKKFTSVHEQKKILVKLCRLLQEPWRKDVFIEEIPESNRRPLYYTPPNRFLDEF